MKETELAINREIAYLKSKINDEPIGSPKYQAYEKELDTLFRLRTIKFPKNVTN